MSCKRAVRPPVESGGELGLFLEVQQGSQTSLRVVRGYLRLHASWSRGIRPHLELRGTLSFRLAAGTAGFSPVSIGETGLLLRCQGKVGIPL